MLRIHEATPKKQQFYGHLPPILQTSDLRWTRHAEYCNVFICTSTHEPYSNKTIIFCGGCYLRYFHSSVWHESRVVSFNSSVWLKLNPLAVLNIYDVCSGLTIAAGLVKQWVFTVVSTIWTLNSNRNPASKTNLNSRLSSVRLEKYLHSQNLHHRQYATKGKFL